MIEVMLLAIALSMDAFAVSIGLGTKNTHQKFTLSILAGLYFGAFQGLMPLVGYLGGIEVFAWVEVYAVLIASLLIVFVGGKMIYEALSTDIESDTIKITHKVMLVLAIATSIDALAAGFSLTILDFNPFIACFIIAFTTFMFSFLGVFIGAKSGRWLESKAELFGGIVLILLGLKLLLV